MINITKTIFNVLKAVFGSGIITGMIAGILYKLDPYVGSKLNLHVGRSKVLRFILVIVFFVLWYLLYKQFSYNPAENYLLI